METRAAARLMDRWSTAERAGDVENLRGILAEEFRGVGPVGFVLPRDAWLARFTDGWSYESLTVDDLTFRGPADWKIGIGVVKQVGLFKGRRTEGRFRATFVVDLTRGKVAGIQFTPIAEQGSKPSQA